MPAPSSIPLSACLLLAATLTAHADPASWPAFRGHGDSNATALKNLPVDWSDEKNIAWRITLPGYGQSSPVIHDDLVFVTSTEGRVKQTMHGHAVSLNDGAVVWSKRIEASQKMENGKMVSRAAPTPVADERGVYFFFESGDLLAMNHDGGELWSRSLTKEYGDILGGHGLGSSPANAPDALVILVDHQGPGYLVSIDKATGKNRWKVDRPKRGSWSSPIYTENSGRGEILVNAGGIVEAYEAESGNRLWFAEGIEGNTVSSPSATEDLVIAASSSPQSTVAIRRDGRGDVSDTHIVWTAERVTSSFSSPAILGDRAYFVSDSGAARGIDLATGELKWEARIAGPCWASPVVADNRLYFFTKAGYTTILEIGEDGAPAHLGNPKIGVEGTVVYGVALADGRIVVRTGTELICIAKDAP